MGLAAIASLIVLIVFGCRKKLESKALPPPTIHLDRWLIARLEEMSEDEWRQFRDDELAQAERTYKERRE